MKNLYFIVLLFLSSMGFSQDIYTSIPCKKCPYKIEDKQLIINTLDSFLKSKDKDLESNIHWEKSDFELWRQPYFELWNEDVYLGVKNYYKPVLLGLIDVEKGKKYLIKLAYVSKDDSLNNSSIKLTYNLIANIDPNGKRVSFEKYTNYYLRDWDSLLVGNITYYKKSLSTLNLTECNDLNKFNDSIASIWKVKPIKFVYFSCKDPIEMFNLKGYDFYPAMFYARTGGQVFYGGQNSKYKHVLYSANNKEYYAHELTHFYINQFPRNSRIGSEGVATFFGGSSEKPLEFHLKYLAKYIKSNPDIQLDSLYKKEIRIEENVSTLYSFGGLISKLIFARKGIVGIKQFLEIKEDELQARLPKIFGMKKDIFENYLKLELSKFE